MFSFVGTNNTLLIFLIWLIILVSLFLLNEITRRFKVTSMVIFVGLPIILTILWRTVLSDTTYTDWFHLAKVYSALIGSIGFFLIRHLEKKDKETGLVTWRLRDHKWVLFFPPLILAINILQAVSRDIEIAMTHWNRHSGPIMGEVVGVMGGPWNLLNALAGILNIIAITGWFGIVIRKQTKNDRSKDMLWPDMLSYWIIAYCLWNFTYTYNAIPTHAFYAGLALLIAPTITAFTIGKGAWLQHRAQTLAMWCMFAQTFPSFQDKGIFVVQSTYNETIYLGLSIIALLSNVLVVTYMVYKVKITKRNPYKGELYTDLKEYKTIKSIGE